MSPSRIIVPTILLAGATLVPSLQAFEIDGDGWSLSIRPRIQTRVEYASAKDAEGNDYDIWRNSSVNVKPVNFSMRRLRLSFLGSTDVGWAFNWTFHADGLGATSAGNNVEPRMRFANVSRTIAQDDLSHVITAGLADFTAVSAFTDNSAAHLFPNGRATVAFAIDANTVGLSYRLNAPLFGFQVGIQDEASGNSAYRLSARAWTGLTEELSLRSRAESYLGRPSDGLKHQLALGLDLRNLGNGDNDYSVFVLDYSLHWDAWSAMLDLAAIRRGDTATAGGPQEPALDAVTRGANGFIALVQAGYAIHLDDGAVVEPALRFTWLDLDRKNSDEQAVLRNEGGASGISIDAGVNYYPEGSHHNKFQAGLQVFLPEDGDGDAFVLRVQHQLNF